MEGNLYIIVHVRKLFLLFLKAFLLTKQMYDTLESETGRTLTKRFSQQYPYLIIYMYTYLYLIVFDILISWGAPINLANAQNIYDYLRCSFSFYCIVFNVLYIFLLHFLFFINHIC